jgi:hypothetical protein
MSKDVELNSINWVRLKNTIQLFGFWEMRHNPNFKGVEFDAFKNQSGENAFTLSPQKWIERRQFKNIVFLQRFIGFKMPKTSGFVENDFSILGD